MEHYEKALVIAEEHKYREEETWVLLGLGLACREKNVFQIAIKYYEKALEIAGSGENRQQVTHALTGW